MRDKDKTVEECSAILTENFRNMLIQTKVDKFLSVYISSCKISPVGGFNFAYKADDLKLKFNKDGYNTVVDAIKWQMTLKNKYATTYEVKYFEDYEEIYRRY